MQLFGESFDAYSPYNTEVSEFINFGPWDVANVPGVTYLGMTDFTPFDYGQSFAAAGAQPVSWKGALKQPSSSAIWLSFQFYYDDTAMPLNEHCYFYLWVDPTFFIKVAVDVSGKFSFYRFDGGNYNLIGQTAVNVWLQRNWEHYQIGIVAHPTNGSIEIRKNSATTPVYQISNVNTAPNGLTSFTDLTFGLYDMRSSTTYFDDIFVNDDNGPSANTWPGIARSVMLINNANSTPLDFAPYSGEAQKFGTSVTNDTMDPSFIFYTPLYTSADGDITRIGFWVADLSTPTVRFSIYNDVNGAPGAQLTPQQSMTTFINGDVNHFDLATPLPVRSGEIYWVALAVSNYFTIRWGNYGNTIGRIQGNEDPLPPLATPLPGNRKPANIFVTYANVTNFGATKGPIPSYDASYVFSSVVGDKDVYSLSGVSVPILGVLGISHRIIGKTTGGAGARGVKSLIKSGATEALGDEFALGPTWGGQTTFIDVNPNTGAPWTLAELDALEAGFTISS